MDKVLGERDQTGVQHMGARRTAAIETAASVLAHQTEQLSGHRGSREAEERDQLALWSPRTTGLLSGDKQ